MTRFKKVLAAIMLMTAVIIAACSPEDEPNNNSGNNNGGGTNENVTVITITPQDITSTSAICGGTVSVLDGIMLSEVGVCWGTSSNPTLAGSHVFAGSVEEQFTCAVSGLEPDTKYYVRAYALCGEKFYYGNVKDLTTLNNGGGGTGGNGTFNGHDYVDLGLPSGTLWATCNVGATTPEGYGDYFAWGETQPKTIYNWSTYKYANGDYDQLTKYCGNSEYGYNGFTDCLITLLSVDDAATANWGNGWSIPTDDQWMELYQNTTNTWTTQNGVNGRLFTVSDGHSLFLPAAGYYWDVEHNYIGSNGYYWSSSLDTDYPKFAWDVVVGWGGYGLSHSSRDYGHSVRPVRSVR